MSNKLINTMTPDGSHQVMNSNNADVDFKGLKVSDAPTEDTDVMNQAATKAIMAKDAYRTPIAVVDSTSTSKPTGTSATIDTYTLVEGDRVLFTALTTDNNTVWKVTGIGTALVWTLETDGQAGTGSATEGDNFWASNGTEGNAQYAFDGGSWVKPAAGSMSFGGEPPAVGSSTSGTAGTASTASRSNHSHDLGEHAHTGSTDGGALSYMSNPMTAIGQLIYGGVSGVATALAVGVAGAVLVSGASAAPSWSTNFKIDSATISVGSFTSASASLTPLMKLGENVASGGNNWMEFGSTGSKSTIGEQYGAQNGFVFGANMQSKSTSSDAWGLIGVTYSGACLTTSGGRPFAVFGFAPSASSYALSDANAFMRITNTGASFIGFASPTADVAHTMYGYYLDLDNKKTGAVQSYIRFKALGSQMGAIGSTTANCFEVWNAADTAKNFYITNAGQCNYGPVNYVGVHIFNGYISETVLKTGGGNEIHLLPKLDADGDVYWGYAGYNGGATRSRGTYFCGGKNNIFGYYTGAGIWNFGLSSYTGGTLVTFNGVSDSRVQFGTSTGIFGIGRDINSTYLTFNGTTYNGGNYVESKASTQIMTGIGGFYFKTAPAGTAGNAITYTNAATCSLTGAWTLGVVDGLNNLTIPIGQTSGGMLIKGSGSYGFSIGSKYGSGTTIIASNAYSNSTASDAWYASTVSTGVGSTAIYMGVLNTQKAFDFRYRSVASATPSSADTYFGTSLGSCSSGGVWILGYTGMGDYHILYGYGINFPNVITASSSTNAVFSSNLLVKASSSSLRYKENIATYYDGALEKVRRLRPVTFTYKESHCKDDWMQIGFIAEEVAVVEPGLIDYMDNTITGEKRSIIENVKYAQMTALLTKAIQEQQAIIESQAARIAVLELAA